MTRKLVYWGSLTLPAALFAALVWMSSVPLGVPGEWEWHRIEPSAAVISALLPAILYAVFLVGFVWLGAKRIDRAGTGEVAAWLAGLAMAGFGWLWVAQEAAPEGYGLSKAVWVLYYPGSSGYFTHARYHIADTREFLRNYEDLMSQGDVLHIGTHPPGLIVGYRGLIAICRKFPSVAVAALASRPEEVRAASHFVVTMNERQPGRALTTDDEAVLWIAALAMQVFAAAAVIPLFGVLRQCGTRRAAWIAASFWPAVPALAVFLPKSDAMYPFWALLFLWLWHEGWKRRSLLFCSLAGIVLWIGLFLSLVFLPVVLFAAIRSWCEGRRSGLTSPQEANPASAPGGANSVMRSGDFALLAFGAIGCSLPIVFIKLLLGANLLTIWLWNFRNHAAFYSHFHRTYWKWLFVNPLEIAVAAGLPLALLAVWSIVQRRQFWNGSHNSLAVATAITWGILLLSGKNMGEAARLWICFIPWIILVAAPLFERPSSPTSAPHLATSDDRPWIAALGLQLAFSLAIVACIVGFHPG